MRMADSTATSFITGSEPGRPRHVGQTCAFGYAPNAVEQPRREWFLRGTSQALIAAAPPEARRPRFTNPVAGSVYALDPDIPPRQQRLAIAVSGAAATHMLWLDGQRLGAADAAPLVFPRPGRHQLRLTDAAGRVIDQSLFSVR